MKKTIIACTITLCGLICTVGYFIACACGKGIYTSFLLPEKIIITIFSTITVASLIVAIKNVNTSD